MSMRLSGYGSLVALAILVAACSRNEQIATSNEVASLQSAVDDLAGQVKNVQEQNTRIEERLEQASATSSETSLAGSASKLLHTLTENDLKLDSIQRSVEDVRRQQVINGLNGN